jgi:ABC-type lipoprotein export system ATPase subunit
MEEDELSQSDPPTEVDLSPFRNGQEARDTDIFIAVMGVTGAGKSTLISHLTTEGVRPEIGNSLSSCS